MKKGMLYKLTASFGAVLLLFTLVLGTVFFMMFRQHAITLNRTEMEKKALSIAETLSEWPMMGGGGGRGNGGGHGAHMGGGYGAYLQFLDELAMAEVWVVDQALSLIAPRHGHEMTYAGLPDGAEQLVQRVFSGEVVQGAEFSGLLDTPTLTVGAPIRQGETVVGAVLLHSPVAGVDQAVRQGLSALLLGAVCALALSLLWAWRLSYHFTRPLEKIKTTALALAQGDYTANTGVVQADEIGQLGEAVDQLAERLSQAEQKRADLDRLKDEFVANVSHELRTPVAVLRGSLEVLEDGTVCDREQVAEYYRQMLTESRHLERLVNDLLDLTRLQDARFVLDMGEVALPGLLADAARAIRRAAAGKGVSVVVSAPEGCESLQGDYGRLRQLLLILLDNGVKFSPEGSQVTLAAEESGTGITLSVTDHGVGIAPEVLPQIFGRFQTVRSQENQSGTGLGLSIAKQIAQRHGGEMFAESGGGTTKIWVTFKK